MADIISTDDLPADVLSSVEESQIVLMVAGANARASRVAPCLASTDPVPTTDQLAEARLVLVGAVRRWSEAGSGALTSQTAGPFSQTVDNRQRTGYNLWPSEIEQLQDICAQGAASVSAFSFSISGGSSAHQPWCSSNFGALYCSCGADLTNYAYPLYESGDV